MRYSHTIGIERLTKDLIRACCLGAEVKPGTLAIIERSNGDLVKVCATSVDERPHLRFLRRHGITTVTAALTEGGRNLAHTYGATWIGDSRAMAAAPDASH